MPFLNTNLMSAYNSAKGMFNDTVSQLKQNLNSNAAELAKVPHVDPAVAIPRVEVAHHIENVQRVKPRSTWAALAGTVNKGCLTLNIGLHAHEKKELSNIAHGVASGQLSSRQAHGKEVKLFMQKLDFARAAGVLGNVAAYMLTASAEASQMKIGRSYQG